jgi:hypothetical protein
LASVPGMIREDLHHNHGVPNHPDILDYDQVLPGFFDRVIQDLEPVPERETPVVWGKRLAVVAFEPSLFSAYPDSRFLLGNYPFCVTYPFVAADMPAFVTL